MQAIHDVAPAQHRWVAAPSRNAQLRPRTWMGTQSFDPRRIRHIVMRQQFRSPSECPTFPDRGLARKWKMAFGWCSCGLLRRSMNSLRSASVRNLSISGMPEESLAQPGCRPPKSIARWPGLKTSAHGRVARNDSVEHRRITLREDHAFAPARGTADKIRVRRGFRVVVCNDLLYRLPRLQRWGERRNRDRPAGRA